MKTNNIKKQDIDIQKNSEIEYSNEFTKDLNITKAKQSKLLPKTFKSPIFVMWDITYRCPFNCIFCYNNSGANAKEDDLQFEYLLRIANDIIDNQVVTVCLCGGEPFVRLREFVALARKLTQGGVLVSCVTNGWYITEEILKQIYGLIRTIQFSLDGPDADTHDYIRGKKGAFEHVVNAIKLISNSPFEKCDLAYLPTKVNYHLFPDVVELAIRLNCINEIRTQYLVMTGRAHDLDISLNTEQKEEFKEIFKSTKMKYKGKIKLNFGDPWSHIYDWCERRLPPLFLEVTSSGKAKISPYIPLKVGDLKTEPLGIVWRRVNEKQDYIAEYLRRFYNFDDYPEDRIAWIDEDIDLLEDLL